MNHSKHSGQVERVPVMSKHYSNKLQTGCSYADISTLLKTVFILNRSQPTYKKVNEELFLDKPLHVILNKSKLAYRIYVFLIANKD
jgi:hypothetical protein